MVGFKPLPDKEFEIITRITKRAYEIRITSDITALQMDLIAVHQNDVRLDFEKLLQADDFDFAHDICCIRSNLNRKNGKLENHFLPRCAKGKGDV